MNTKNYDLCINQISKLIDRRQIITTTYLSVNTAIIGGIAFLLKDGQFSGWRQEIVVVVLLFSGSVACAIWRILITQYRLLLEWWYKQIRLIEKSSLEIGVFTKEYDELYVNRSKKTSISLTRYEVYLTWLFTLLYISFAIAIIISIIYT